MEKLKNLEINYDYAGTQLPIPIMQKDIDDLETFLKLKLPQDYQEYLLKYNGGFPLNYYVHLIGRENEAPDKGFRIENAYAIDPKGERGSQSIKNVYLASINTGYKILDMPKHLLPLADNGGGGHLCISLAPGDELGKIYLWDDNFNHDDPREEYHNFLVANSFTEFLNKLYRF